MPLSGLLLRTICRIDTSLWCRKNLSLLSVGAMDKWQVHSHFNHTPASISRCEGAPTQSLLNIFQIILERDERRFKLIHLLRSAEIS